MKTTNNISLIISLLLSFIITLSGCGEDDYKGPAEYCGPLTGKTIDREIGRVYYRNVTGYQVYYIGNPDTTKRNYAGVIPCNGLPDAYIPGGDIGVLVRYSGGLKSNVQSSHKNPYDPYYGGIDLTFIEKVDEESK